MVCLGNICINTLHKGAKDDGDDDDDNNNNNNMYLELTVFVPDREVRCTISVSNCCLTVYNSLLQYGYLF
jgi:hypothetical protein